MSSWSRQYHSESNQIFKVDGMNTRWIVVADMVSAKIFATDPTKAKCQLLPIQELVHLESLERNQDLNSDRAGRYQTDFSNGGSYSEHDSQANEQDKFAQTITSFLEHGRTTNQCQSILLIAAPHMVGLLEKHMTKHLKSMNQSTIQKNMIHMSQQELEEALSRK